jgi:predicted dehydrogenase/threonine dehydrogenase-like Zn-dependent dehydrogenase
MYQVTDNYWNGEVTLEEVCAPTVREGCVLVRTAYSLISAGTERMKVQQSQKSLVGKARARPDQLAKTLETLARDGMVATFEKVMNRLKTPVPLGYSLAGEVIAIGDGVHEFRVGDRVACAGSSANHAEFTVIPTNLCAAVPDNVSLDLAACATVGAIALQGVRQANPQIGDVVAVVGLGLVGQFCVQLLVASGCKVVGFDLDPARLELARSCGAHSVGLSQKHAAKVQVEDLSHGMGADVVLIAASSNTSDPVELAGEIARDRARIVDIGKTRLELPWEVFYEKELDFRMSRSYGPGRYDPSYEENGVDYPVGYVRWTEKRNMELFLDMMAQGKVRPQAIVNRQFAIAEAERAYQTLLEEKSALGILLEYSASATAAKPQGHIELRTGSRPSNGQLRMGVIGAGNHCKSMILPHLRKNTNVSLIGVCAATGLSATDTGRRFGFQYATTDTTRILDDPQLNTVLIATRHNLHAPLAVSALRAGKSVFVEKPLTIKEADLNELEKQCGEGASSLMVGYNRRFAPMVLQLRRWMQSQSGPWIGTCRINAGRLPLNHWYYDPEQGGGRLLGEVCHFVDLFVFLFACQPVSVNVQSTNLQDAARPAEDNAIYTVCFASGSVAQIIYTAEGDSSVGKERLEIIGNGGIATLDNFRRLDIVQNGRKRTWRTLFPDKGHRAALTAFLKAARSGSEMPINLNGSFLVSRVCFRLRDALRTGRVIAL